MPSRRSVLGTLSATLPFALAGCSSLSRLRAPAGADWTASVPEPTPMTPPSAAGGLVAVGGRRDGDLETGRVVVFDAETGERQWSRDVGRLTGLVAAGGGVYAGEKTSSRRGRVRAFDAGTGERRWTRAVDNLASAMTVADGTLYAANGTLAAIDTDDGSVRWERNEVGGVGFTVVVAPDDQLAADDRAVYFGDTDAVVALDPADGTLAWRWDAPESAWTSAGPLPAGDVVYVGRDGEVVALDPSIAAPQWRTSFGDDARVMGLHETGSSLLVAEATDEAPSDAFGTVYELSLQDGHERYETRFDTPVAGTASTPETFVVGTRGGRLVWADGASMFARPEATLPDEGFALGAAGERAFVQSRNGRLWALSPPE
jgi:outer membrane protein assembly factor BamB